MAPYRPSSPAGHQVAEPAMYTADSPMKSKPALENAAS